MATFTACRLVDPTSTTAAHLLGDAAEHLYQLNHVYVVPPSNTDIIKTLDGKRLFAQLDCWDFSNKITLAFRSKAMLQLAQLEDDQAHEYEQRIANDELRHSILSSLRVRVKRKSDAAIDSSQATDRAAATELSQPQATDELSIMVVEAQSFTFVEIPNDSVDTIHGLLAGRPQTSERLAKHSETCC